MCVAQFGSFVHMKVPLAKYACHVITIAGHRLGHPRYSVTAVFKDEIG